MENDDEQTNRSKVQLHTCTGRECSTFDHAWCTTSKFMYCPYVQTYDIEKVEFILEDEIKERS